MKPLVNKLATAGDSAPSSAEVVDATIRGGLVTLAATMSRTSVAASHPIDHHKDPTSGEVKKPKSEITPTFPLVRSRRHHGTTRPAVPATPDASGGGCGRCWGHRRGGCQRDALPVESVLDRLAQCPLELEMHSWLGLHAQAQCDTGGGDALDAEQLGWFDHTSGELRGLADAGRRSRAGPRWLVRCRPRHRCRRRGVRPTTAASGCRPARSRRWGRARPCRSGRAARCARRVIRSTMPTASPRSTSSPMPYWSSMIMNSPVMQSLTRLCAPKPSAMPAMPGAGDQRSEVDPQLARGS